MSSRSQSPKTHLLACVAAGGFWILGATSVLASNCGCQSSCQSCPSAPSCECECGCQDSKWLGGHRIKKAFGKFTGHFERILGVGNCGGCDDANCDDACDAAMIEELSLPESHLHHHHTAPLHQHAVPMPQAIREMPMTSPDPPKSARPMPNRSTRTLPDPSELDEPSDRVPPPVRMREPAQPKQEEKEEGSLFDTLSNPFQDDTTSKDTLRTIRPSNYTRYAGRVGSSLQPLSRDGQSSRRRVSSSRR